MSTDEVAVAPEERDALAEAEAAAADELGELIQDWVAVPDAAELMGVPLSRVRAMLREGQLLGVRRGTPRTLQIPAELILDGQPLAELPGTLNVLYDARYSQLEALRWLFTPDDTLPGTPVSAMRKGWRGEIRRRAQALAF